MRDRLPASPDLSAERRRMVERQLRRRGIRDERVLEAMGRVPRELFVAPDVRLDAYMDTALPIGHDQSISQPYMVARICEELRLAGPERVLDVGAGSAYQSAVLAELAAAVVAIEVIPELAAQARRNLTEAGCERVELVVGDGSLGYPAGAPYGAIAVAAAAPAVPPALYDQLEPGGRLVVPVGARGDQELQVVEKRAGGPAIVHSVPCRFVPLVGAGGFAVEEPRDEPQDEPFGDGGFPARPRGQNERR